MSRAASMSGLESVALSLASCSWVTASAALVASFYFDFLSGLGAPVTISAAAGSTSPERMEVTSAL